MRYIVVMNLEEFCAKYPPHLPRRAADDPSELRLLTEAEGVRQLESPPAETTVLASPRQSPDVRYGRHLWVFREAVVPYILEAAPMASPALASGVAKHTNLTGGLPASCGGEMWIDPADERLLYVNGASGRYGPQTPQQLTDAVSVFHSRGFEVVSFGWDEDVNKPARILRT
jgi:hypothetical protein